MAENTLARPVGRLNGRPSSDAKAEAIRERFKVYLGPSCSYSIRRTHDERLQTREDTAEPGREWYRISGLAKFKRVGDVCKDLEFIKQALASSTDFEVDASREWTRLRLVYGLTRILVLGFPATVSKQDVRSVFAGYGVIGQLEIRPLADGLNSVARIRFSSPEVAKRVLDKKTFAFGSYELTTVPAPDIHAPKTPPNQDVGCSIRAFGFEAGTSVDAVKKYFQLFAQVKSVVTSNDKLFYAIVEFNQESDAGRVASLVHTFDGMPLSVSLCARSSEGAPLNSRTCGIRMNSSSPAKRNHKAALLPSRNGQLNSVLHFSGVDPTSSSYDSLLRAFSEVLPVASVDYRRDETSGYVMLREPCAKECAEELAKNCFRIGLHQVKLRAISGHEESTFWSCFALRQSKRHRPNTARTDLQRTTIRADLGRQTVLSHDSVPAQPKPLQHRVEEALPVAVLAAQPANQIDGNLFSKRSPSNATQKAQSCDLRGTAAIEANGNKLLVDQPVSRNDTPKKQNGLFSSAFLQPSTPGAIASVRQTLNTLRCAPEEDTSCPASVAVIPSGYQLKQPEKTSLGVDTVSKVEVDAVARKPLASKRKPRQTAAARKNVHEKAAANGVIGENTPKLLTARKPKVHAAKPIADADGEGEKLPSKGHMSQEVLEVKQPSRVKRKEPAGKGRGRRKMADLLPATDLPETASCVESSTQNDTDDLGKLLDLFNEDLENARAEPAMSVSCERESVWQTLPLPLSASVDKEEADLGELMDLFNQELHSLSSSLTTQKAV